MVAPAVGLEEIARELARKLGNVLDFVHQVKFKQLAKDKL
jgi:hypothetical protein